MPFQILSNTAASITDLKRDPMGTVRSAEGETIAILNRNEPAFYCVPPAVYQYLMELAEDAELGRIADERISELADAKEISLDDL
ncbi:MULTISPECIES: type II toxin-antitoxin system Phd/YefM family antitoxin [Pantoea]|jgi:Antitoxin of toxin-antitoxin stability system|uniref:Type II toxin-antitoxin system Phd/YefM family antitoxin n=1 Tax=Pantoea dispersa TaxID=59814 RepID=A0ABY2ZYY3_9GAMM|nr:MULTISPECIES: type II toxin-antitoxin system Phd/YefM family antitoxin [Pantoea]MBK4771647.1 type II toxin-antitoxin system Phd/YefM family antitoxin [Pantoea sp. Morm]MBK4783170.1 type II toxin-antitoxin system Phd/YefM family antitoxin [Pantoea sp. Pent]KAA6094313.1 type II toxin-antitoxin system Phd/YefM family antitoxin [Pantoea sp. B_9]KAA6107844.1 type II toxin-antitoxin system Phd/YefM family antitoxin [Pantoea sp. B_10]KAA8673682.1 type II toxin-antitoxin system Phd/YefM family anti